MSEFTYFVGITLFTAVYGQEWVFQKVKELNGLIPKSTANYLYHAPTGPVSDCFQYCVLHQECNTVINTGKSCYASIYPTDTTYTTRIPSYDYHCTYFKRPVGVCDKDGYVYYKGVCVKPSSSFKTWNDAKIDCEATGGQLMSLDTSTKFSSTVELLTDMFTMMSAGTKYFVGANDLETEGSWKWIGNPSSNFFTFYASQPNNADVSYPSKAANCGILRFKSKTGIHDEYCQQELQYLCEAN